MKYISIFILLMFATNINAQTKTCAKIKVDGPTTPADGSAFGDGALLARTVKDMPYLYHFGIMYKGKVAHYNQDGFQYTSIEKFAEGGISIEGRPPVRVVLKGKTGKDLDEFRKRYLAIITKYKNSKNNALNNNCEHFAYELLFNVHKSLQSETVVNGAKTYWEPVKQELLIQHPELKNYVGALDAYIQSTIIKATQVQTQTQL